ncbi:MAG: squalene--hopene cyclase [Planctomycetales bacterium]|nr:squalene--hopene cyclase [Planctomycetales bacterium]
MTFRVDRDRLAAAFDTARSDLLAQRNSAGHWVGELCSSPLSTATAISALVLAEQGGTSCGLPAYRPGEEPSHVDEIYRGDLSELIVHSLHWLAQQQNEDGGWGDTDRSRSNIATTMLVRAAFHLTGVPAKYANLLERAERYVEKQGGIAGLKRRYGNDKTFAVPILANCALADMVSWRKVAPLPFELACLPQRWYRLLKLQVVSYAIPALVVIGLARHYHAPSRNPLVRWIRTLARRRCLALLQEIQPASGGFLEATPLTSFVVMGLASMGLSDHPVVRRGIEFLLTSVRSDGSWPIDTNLATWNTSQAITALADEQEDIEPSLDWLLACQCKKEHPYTGSAPGGWGWTDLTGSVPDGDDTAAALLALSNYYRAGDPTRDAKLRQAALAGIRWLLDLQNSDGGWPTFCRGWGKLAFDRSSNDITAHVLRALHAWSGLLQLEKSNPSLSSRISTARRGGLDYLQREQAPDGSWTPLWFGNENHPLEANPVYGTARVVRMYGDLGLGETEAALRGAHWLVGVQLASGGWGAAPGTQQKGGNGEFEACESVEETSLAIEALVPLHAVDGQIASSVEQGVSWLIDAVAENRHHEPAPIGFYFAKLWYYERLYPQIFATQALARASQVASAEPTPVGAVR